MEFRIIKWGVMGGWRDGEKCIQIVGLHTKAGNFLIR